MSLLRFMLAAPSSGSGKTLITCGILKLLKERGLNVCSFKCGPDYIDPMFHSRVLGVKSRNLDSFFTDEDTLRYLTAKNSEGADIAVMEGVMGYYDGLAGFSDKASTYDIARITKTPVILIVNCKGMSLSVVPYIKGFLEYRKESNIKGVILNRISPVLYNKMKDVIEDELAVKVLGYVPQLQFSFESRHLGLVMPDEIKGLQENIADLSGILKETLDVDKLLCLAESAAPLEKCPDCSGSFYVYEKRGPFDAKAKRQPLRIGLAKDEAFCFFYEDNLDLLRQMGAVITEFSPIHDEHLPEGLDGLLLCGGYPELYAKELSENTSMRLDISRAVKGGLPTVAECGGFMYLHEKLQGEDGKYYDMTGVIEGSAYRKETLTRFGYITLSGGKVFGRDTGPLRSHEFHYYDSENPGEAFLAQKPLSERSWRCIHSTDTLFAGFPHIYFYADKKFAESFMEAVLRRKNGL